VDRWDRRRVMLCCDSVRALALGSIPMLAATGRLTLPQLYAVAVLEGALLVFYHTAHMAALPRLVGTDRLGQAAAREESTYYCATLAGRRAGGVLYSLGHALPFLAD